MLDAFVGSLDGSHVLRSRLSAASQPPNDTDAVEAAVREARAHAQRAVEEFEAQGARAVLDAVRAAGDERPLA